MVPRLNDTSSCSWVEVEDHEELSRERDQLLTQIMGQFSKYEANCLKLKSGLRRCSNIILQQARLSQTLTAVNARKRTRKPLRRLIPARPLPNVDHKILQLHTKLEASENEAALVLKILNDELSSWKIKVDAIHCLHEQAQNVTSLEEIRSLDNVPPFTGYDCPEWKTKLKTLEETWPPTKRELRTELRALYQQLSPPALNITV